MMPESSEEGKKQLEASGHSVELHTFPGMAHSMHPRQPSLLRAFLDKHNSAADKK